MDKVNKANEMPESEQALRKRLYKLFKALGIGSASSGYSYATEAVVLRLLHSKYEKVGDIYRHISEEKGVSYAGVERAIRYARRNIYEDNRQLATEIFGDRQDISNSKFICEICEYIRYNGEGESA